MIIWVTRPAQLLAGPGGLPACALAFSARRNGPTGATV